ncbi:MAG: HD domain-containing protein [Oscillospiraceae bacterium]|nr:HD domain-containing protein [Oscillospiraceae bacterium]
MVTYKEVRENEDIKTYIKMADATLASMKFTEHSFAHVVRCADVAGMILEKLGFDERTVELAQIAAYMHDIGNVVNRIDHAQSGAVMAFRLLDKMGMKAEEISRIVTAIGNHDEKTAYPVNEIAAALIIADKSDVRRSRVRVEERATINTDIHDRVNYAVEKSKLVFDEDDKKFTLFLTIDEKISLISEYFEIFLDRMMLCRRAADYFGAGFEVNINGTRVM